MGMYDYFQGSCPQTGKEFCLQTKLMDCDMVAYHVGATVPLPDGRLKLKETCEHCGEYHSVIVTAGVVTGFDHSRAEDQQEGLYGAVLDADDSREAQFNREVLSQVTN